MKHIKQILTEIILVMMLPVLAIGQSGAGNSQQYKHVEIVTFKPGTSDSSKHIMDKTYRQAAYAFPLVKAFEWGWDDNDKSQNTRIYTTTFNSKGDLTTYTSSPACQNISKSKPSTVVSITKVDYPVNK